MIDRAKRLGRVAAKVFCRGQDRARLFRGGYDCLTGTNGNPQRFLDDGMLAGQRRGYRHLMVHGRIGDHVHRQYVGVGQHVVQVGIHERLLAEEALNLSGTKCGILRLHVADGNDLDVADATVFELLVGKNMTVAHATTSNHAQRNLFQNGLSEVRTKARSCCDSI